MTDIQNQSLVLILKQYQNELELSTDIASHTLEPRIAEPFANNRSRIRAQLKFILILF